MTSSTTTTTTYHAVMIDETGCEFPTSVEARTREEALHILEEMYPESRCDQLETEEDTARREKAIYDHINAGGDWDDEGRPIFHYHYPQDNNDEEN